MWAAQNVLKTKWNFCCMCEKLGLSLGSNWKHSSLSAQTSIVRWNQSCVDAVPTVHMEQARLWLKWLQKWFYSHHLNLRTCMLASRQTQFNSALNTWYACCSYQLSLRWRKSWIKPPCEGNKSSIFGDCCAYKKTLYSKSNITGWVVFKSAQSLWFFQPQPAGESRLSSPTTEQRISHLTPTQHSQLHTEGQTTQSTITELSKWTQFTFFWSV